MKRRCFGQSGDHQSGDQRLDLSHKDGIYHRRHLAHHGTQERTHRQYDNQSASAIHQDELWLSATSSSLPQHRDISRTPQSPRRATYTNTPLRPSGHVGRDRQQIDSGIAGESAYNDNLNNHSNVKFSFHNGSPLSSLHLQPNKQPIPMRLLWFRTNHTQQPKVVTLLNRFGHEGMEIQVIETIDEQAIMAQRLPCALIMLECFNTVEQEMLNRLNHVRAESDVPIIVLTDNHTLDWSLLALREGADAIFTLNTPDDIIIARSNALLRRWISR